MAVLKTARTFLCSLMLAGLVAAPGAAAPAAPTEYQVKAVFLFNFSRFVEWPSAAFAGAAAPFAICVFGTDPFGTDLDEVVKGEAAGARPIVVRRLNDASQVPGCQILFIDHVEEPRTAEVTAAADRRHVLTVGDHTGPSQQGLMIRLVTERGRVRLRVDVESARAAGLTINSNLLRSAEIVSPRGGRP